MVIIRFDPDPDPWKCKGTPSFLRRVNGNNLQLQELYGKICQTFPKIIVTS